MKCKNLDIETEPISFGDQKKVPLATKSPWPDLGISKPLDKMQ